MTDLSSIKNKLHNMTKLPSLPNSYVKVQQLMNDKCADIADFAAIVRLDPCLTVAVLKMVNSSLFGFPRKVDSVKQATNLIGIDQLHTIVLGLSAVSSLKVPSTFLPLELFWRGSLFTGVLAQLLAKHKKIPKSDLFFVEGLLHEIGHIVLYEKFPEVMQDIRVISEAEAIHIHTLEQEVIGFHYGDVGAFLLEQWGLPEIYQIVIRHQPQPNSAPSKQVDVALLHLARAYAQQELGILSVVDAGIHSSVWGAANITPDVVEDELEQAQAITQDMQSILDF